VARETSYALCVLDLDQFKIVNDTWRSQRKATRCSARVGRAAQVKSPLGAGHAGALGRPNEFGILASGELLAR